MKMSKLYKNWTIHNLISHPLSEVAYWIVRPLGKKKSKDVSVWIHDISLPNTTVAQAQAQRGKE